MLKKNYFKYAKFFAIFILVFFLSTFKVKAQCPTLNSSPPPMPICNASGYTLADLSADYVLDGGNGIKWYADPTGGSPINSSQLVSEKTYYIDDNSGSCSSRLSITVTFQIHPTNAKLDGIYCSNDNPTVQTYIDEVLQPYIPLGGSVEVYNNYELTDLASTSDAIPAGAKNRYIVFYDGPNATGCSSQIEVAKTALFVAPTDPAPTNPQYVCSNTNPTIGDLDPGTLSPVSWYQNVDINGNPIPPALSLSTALVSGNTYYVQVDDASCNSHSMPVTVIVSDPYDPGTSNTLEYCDDSVPPSPFNLFDILGGSPDTNGTWTGPIATTNGNQGTVDISTATAGVYTFTYTVPSNGGCPQDSADITITIYETLTSGTVSLASPATFCESTASVSFDLSSLLDNEDPNGQWTQGTLSIDPVVTSPFDLTTLAIGTHDFTYTQNVSPSTCPEESTSVKVVILPDSNAGIANNQTFCENDLAANSPFNLFDALTAPYDSGGTWTDASNTTVADPLNLVITGYTVAGSPYTFDYTVDNGFCTDTETITITIAPAPESGTPVATFPEYCEDSTPTSFDLYSLIDGENGTGTWTNNNTSTTVVDPSNLNLSTFSADTYNFTFKIDPLNGCIDDDVVVSVIINPLPNTGTPNNPPPFCENDPALNNTAFDLFTLLTGPVDSGGTWSDDSTTPVSGALSGSDVDLTLLTIGTYSFTYTITDANTCTNSSTVVVTIEPAPESGEAIAVFPEYCEADISGQMVNLFDLLDGTQDTNGTWYEGTDTSGSGTVVSNSIDISSFTANTYNYTYSVPDIGNCSDKDVTVQIIINPQPNSGTPSPAIFCENDLTGNSPLDLFGQLAGNDSGGTWSDDNATGLLTGSDLDITGLAVGSYNFTYSVTNAFGCTNSSTVVVTIEPAPESGTANSPVEFCLESITTGQTYNLFDLLAGEDQTGTWSDDDSTGALSGNTVTLDGLAPATYNFTYDVTAIGSCDDVDVTVQIIINDTPAPTANTPQEFCDSATVANLVTTSGTSIQWYDAATGGNLLADTTALVDGQIYYASQTDATTGCESSVRTVVTVTIYKSPNAGAPNSTGIVTCNNSTIDLNSGLDGTQDLGGIWYEGSDNTGTVVANPTTYDVTGLAANNYQFTYYVVASAPCIDDSATITVTVEAPLNAGTDNTIDICSNSGTIDLFTQLGGTPETGGTWSPAMASTTGVFDPLVDASGTYIYSLTNACGTFSSQVDVTVTQAPNAGSDNTALICVIDGVTDLFPLLGADAQSGGVWSPALTSGTGEFDPSIDASGVYTYTVAATGPCSPDSVAEITVTVSDTPAPVVVEVNPEFCLADNPTVLDLNSVLTLTGTVNWYEDAALTIVANLTDNLIDGEDYYATQTNSEGCESSTSSVQITAIINDISTPTLADANQEYCINDNPAPTISDLTLNITEHDTNSVVWYDAETGGNIISSSTELSNLTSYYAVLVDATTGCESSVRLEVTPDITSCGKLVLPDGFSPNNDGVNDTFDYNNLDILYPNFEIEIFNRYGNVVYKGNASTPRFNGKSNQSRSIVKGDLPVGVYYYIFKFNDNTNKPEQGHLYLSR